MARQGLRFTDLLERVSRYVEQHPGADAREVQLAVPAMRGLTDRALRRLELAGFIERYHERGQGWQRARYRSFKPYRGAA